MANPNIVAVTNILGGNLGFNLSSSATATLLTVAADKILKINRITVANVDGTSAADVSLFVDGMGNGATGITATGSATVYLAKTVSVPADATLVLVDTPIYLMEGDILKGGASASGDLDLFISIAKVDAPKEIENLPLRVIIPAFMISELKRGFEIGFLIFLPFLIIDIVVASVLMAMGMMMMPPVMISLPFKLMLFVLVDGWHLILGSMIRSFVTL